MPISFMSFPTRILFGAGALERLPAEVQRFTSGPVLLVADPGVAAAGLVERAGARLTEAGIRWSPFLGVSPEPREEDAWAGAQAFRDGDAQLIVGLGGGAALDVAKAIRLTATHAGPLEQYDDRIDGGEKIRGGMPPFIAIPTTAGTGSEVGRSTVLLLASSGLKTVIFSPHLLADCALLDPELTVGLPARLTAATGFDALTHCVEAYLARGEHPFADALAIDGLRRVATFLPRAVDDGADLPARMEMQIAAAMGAVAFQKGLGAAHALAHALGPLAGLHHGLANALVLPEVLRFNARGAAAAEAGADPAPDDTLRRLADCAVALGADVRASIEERADGCADRVAALRARVGLPGRLRDAGVQPQMREALIQVAMKDGCHLGSPRRCTPADFGEILDRAM